MRAPSRPEEVAARLAPLLTPIIKAFFTEQGWRNTCVP